MNLVQLAVLLAVLAWSGESQSYPIPHYELRRPMQYFFHLLELKSKFNPMLGGISKMGPDCSSKMGPFCSLTGHPPLQTYQLRASAISDNDRNIELVLANQLNQNSIAYQDILRRQSEVFLIRN